MTLLRSIKKVDVDREYPCHGVMTESEICAEVRSESVEADVEEADVASADCHVPMSVVIKNLELWIRFEII